MSPRTIAAFGGTLLGCSFQVFMVERVPMVAAGGAVLAVLVLLWALTRKEPMSRITDAVLYEAHRAALRLNDDAGQDAIAAELERRREVRRG